MHAVLGTLIGRWWVTLFGLTFLWCAVRQLGWRRTLLYTIVAVAFVIGGDTIGAPRSSRGSPRRR